MKAIIALLSLAAACSSAAVYKRADGRHNPTVISAVDRQPRHQDPGQWYDVFPNATAGEDYPILAEIPAANVQCGSVAPGFYANDGAGKCQAFDRCDITGNLTSYLCPNLTLFNQISLVCEGFWNVDCAKVREFYDYSNSRLYQEGVALVDDEPDFVLDITGATAWRSASGGGVVEKHPIRERPKREFQHQIEKRAAGNQSPKVFSALAQLSNDKSKMDAGQY